MEKVEQLSEEFSVKIHALNNKLNELGNQLAVHIESERGYRLLALERIESLKVALENTSLKTQSDIAQRLDTRLQVLHTALDKQQMEIASHLKRYDAQEGQVLAARGRRQTAMYSLWIAVAVALLAGIGSFVMTYRADRHYSAPQQQHLPQMKGMNQ